jgi:hypothetical protein
MESTSPISDINLPLSDQNKENQNNINTITIQTPRVTKHQIKNRNKSKSRYNFSKISKYLHILVFEYL